jgi:uncharacterized protein (TIGR02646 family)
MRNVTRGPEPETLARNAREWRRKLKEARNRNKLPPPSLMKKYRQSDVLESLKSMYSDNRGKCYCCYCESPIGIVDYPHIEHRKPKNKFPERAFDWGNLHLACQQCNMAKNNKWDNKNAILDAVIDVPITDYLSYDVGDFGVYRKDRKPRGKTTIKHADLNRDELLRERLYLYVDTVNKICRIKNDPGALSVKQQLRDRCSGPYGSMVKFLIDSLCLECWED